MNPHDYMSATRQTAIYPKDVAIPYLVLGLISEVGELRIATEQGTERAIAKEAGDNLWYVFRLYDEIGTDVQGFEWKRFLSLPFTTDAVFDSLFNSVSTLADITKKSIRDNGGTIPSTKEPDFLSELALIVSLVGTLANTMSVAYATQEHSLESYATANIEKLLSRHARNVIGGSGDER